MAELFHECGVAAVYCLSGAPASPLVPDRDPQKAAWLIPRMLLDIQNRGQLAAGITSYCRDRDQLIDTYKEVGTVNEVFLLHHPERHRQLMEEYRGTAAIGHVRYATCGRDDRSYAQPFERHHIEKWKWFSFAFNGQLANYVQLRDEILSSDDFHLSRQTDTEVLMHLISRELSEGKRPLEEILTALAQRLDGAYNIVLLNALGDLLVARDPLGIRPLCYAVEDGLFAAASESVALANLGFSAESIRNVRPGEAVVIQNGELRIRRFAASPRSAHCFFEWIYFANVASTLDGRSVYLVRKALGEELARQEDLPIDQDTIVVPVPDTAKAAADAMAYRLKVPCLEGLIRNRYVGRTFIEGSNRDAKVRAKYTPLRDVLEGKRVLLVEDTIVRSTTMRALISQIRERGRAREVHVRVACPPIFAPCFYGIDMSTVTELFAPRYMDGPRLTREAEDRMAKDLGADSLRYLPLEAVPRCVGKPREALCLACLNGEYPTPGGERLYELALKTRDAGSNDGGGRTVELAALELRS
ncbi:MAG: amidophosphoribosyltransferase [Planctomycetota bacterium]|nr:MAG: amidophosphoribosyltransferase [Planctomycetota bacterium]